MAHVVCEPCKDCKYTDCVVVCPVDCFHEGERMLTIDPDVCIDCALCIPECPVEAIFQDADVPDQWIAYVELNATEAPSHPLITRKQPPLAGS